MGAETREVDLRTDRWQLPGILKVPGLRIEAEQVFTCLMQACLLNKTPGRRYDVAVRDACPSCDGVPKAFSACYAEKSSMHLRLAVPQRKVPKAMQIYSDMISD